MGVSLLHYRPWRGEFRDPLTSIWPIARVSLWMMARRKLFWGLYFLALLIFLMFFFGQYLLAFVQGQASEESVPIFGGLKGKPEELIKILRGGLGLDGRPETYSRFFDLQGHMVMVVLAMAGSVLVGNDFQFGSLAFYLSKPLGRWHYLAGKFLGLGIFINLMTTVPALVLFMQYGMLDPDSEYWGQYFVEHFSLFAGVLGYGLVLTACLGFFLLATASWLRRTVPMIMAWTTFFFFLRLLQRALVNGLHYDARWRLIDMWNNTYLVGNYLLGISQERVRPQPQPAVLEAAIVLGAACLLCLIYLNRRIRAVEIVS